MVDDVGSYTVEAAGLPDVDGVEVRSGRGGKRLVVVGDGADAVAAVLAAVAAE